MDQNVETQPNQASGNGEHPPLMDQAKQQAQQVMQKTQQKAGEAMDQAREQMRNRLEEQKTAAADSLSDVAQAFRSSGEHLRQQGQGAAPKMADYAQSAADAVQQVAGYLHDKRVDELTLEVEGFARRQPTVFLGGAFALGFLAARFLKSSNPNPSVTSGQTDRTLPARPEDLEAATEVRSGHDTAAAGR